MIELKLLPKVLSAALLLGATAVSAADVAARRAEAAAAFASGDYQGAVQLYSATREAAADGGDDRAWIADTVAMARAQLRLGAPAKARQLLLEFNRKFSVRDSGTLAGEILAAEGRIAEAKEFLRERAADPASDAKSRGEAELALTYLQLCSDDEKERAEALKTLTRLEADEHLFVEARLRRIYALISAGRAAEALELAEASKVDSVSAPRLDLLKLLAKLHTGAAGDFEADWKKLWDEAEPHPDSLMFMTLDFAAKKAMKESRPELAARYWNYAYKFAVSDDARREVLRRLFNCCAAFDIRKAAETAKRYAEAFPDPRDDEARRERAKILGAAGRLLGDGGDLQGALEFFRTAADDKTLLPGDRRECVREAALAAEKIGDQAAAKRYFDLLVSTAGGDAEKHAALLLYAGYLIRRGDFAGAEAMLRDSGRWKEKDQAGRLLIRALAAQDKFAAALAHAEELCRSADPDSAGFGEFHAARMTEKLGRAAEARQRYLKYAADHPHGEFIRTARFAAAELALAGGDCAAAGREFFDYGNAYPQDPAAKSAFFWALRAGCLDGDRDRAAEALSALKRAAGIGSEYYAAALQFLDFLRVSGAGQEGLALLDSVDRSKCTAPESAMLDLMRARLLVARGDRKEAIAAAEQLLDAYPGDSAAADAAFLAGTSYLEDEKPDKALPLLLRALELRRAGAFAEAVSARIAECRLELYKANGRPEDLQAAADDFARLAADARTPAIRLMCRYKLGWCLERKNDPRGAYTAYRQVLRQARRLKAEGRIFDPKWCSRSAYAALHLVLDRQWPNADQLGSAIIRDLGYLELPGGDAEVEAVEEEFKKRHFNRGIGRSEK